MRLRVMTYNIHKCVGGLDRRLDPARVAEVIAHHAPDLVLLQEAESPAPGRGGEDQAALLGRVLGYRHLAFAPLVARRGGRRYGNAVLSRHPILAWDCVDLTVGWKKRRGALHCRLRARSASGRARTLHLYDLHLGLSGLERRVQLKRFLERPPFAGTHARAPVIVGGDFNDVWGTLGRAILAPAGFRGLPRPLPTFPAFLPVRALDSLYVRGDIAIVSAERSRLAAARRASDHLPLVAEVEF